MKNRVVVALAVLGVAGVPVFAIAARPRDAPASEPHLVAVSNIVVPVIDGNRMNGHLSFDLVVDAADANGAARLTAADARIRSTAIVTGLEFSRLYVSGLRPVDAQVLANVLTQALRAEEPDIDRVLIVKVAATMG